MDVIFLSNSCLMGLCFSTRTLYSSWCFFSFASAFSMSLADALSFLSFSSSCRRFVQMSFAFCTATVDSFIWCTASWVVDSSSFTVLCFLCSSSAYFMILLTNSVVFCIIWECNSDRRSADDFKIIHSGENVPLAPPDPALFANFWSNFELYSSKFDRSRKYSVSSLLADNPYFIFWYSTS